MKLLRLIFLVAPTAFCMLAASSLSKLPLPEISFRDYSASFTLYGGQFEINNQKFLDKGKRHKIDPLCT